MKWTEIAQVMTSVRLAVSIEEVRYRGQSPIHRPVIKKPMRRVAACGRVNKKTQRNHGYL
jgi:hypothetical protein